MQSDDTILKKFGKNFLKGAILFRDGDSSKEMYVIHSGKVKITKQIGNTETTIAMLGSGEFFGEMATLLEKPRSATAEVEEDSLLIVLGPQTFGAMISSNPEHGGNTSPARNRPAMPPQPPASLLMLKDNM